MKTKKTAVTIGLILLSAAGLGGCGGPRELVEIDELADNTLEKELITFPMHGTERTSSSDAADSESEGTTQLTALADTLEKAEEIAELYGIELDSYSYGVATYITDKDVQELMNMGEENDYPTLAPNYKNKLHTEQ